MDNRETDPIAQIYVNPIEQPVIAAMYIAPSDFKEAGEYQNFTLHFSLDHVTTGIQFGLNYYGGLNPPPGDWASTDLFVDYILAMREGGLDLPVFAGIFQVTTYPGTPEALQLAENLEMSGVLVLSPEEFMAALNPEFMIDWATPILGFNHSALSETRRQLEMGDYFTSLLTVRNALRTLPEHTYTLEPEEIVVRGNAWVTDLTFNSTIRLVSFRTHGPPEGTARISIIMPNNFLVGSLLVNIDEQPQPYASFQNETHITLTLKFPQGPHQVEVIEPAILIDDS